MVDRANPVFPDIYNHFIASTLQTKDEHIQGFSPPVSNRKTSFYA